jgi:hypothetical protein
VEVIYTRQSAGIGRIDAGLEDEIGANGGTNVADFTGHTSLGGGQYLMTATPTNISWDDRYNYRIGGANIYAIINVKMYKDGTNTDEWGSSAYTMSGIQYLESHCGINLDKSNLNRTSTSVAAGVLYPKSID